MVESRTPMRSKKRDHEDTRTIVSVVLFYFGISIGLVFLNKVLLTDSGTSIPAPLFVTWFQCVFTVLILRMLGSLRKSYIHIKWLAQFPALEIDFNVARNVAPLSLVFVGMVAFNNLCLKYVEVSFYNVARSLTLVFNVVLSRYFLGSSVSGASMLSILAVIAGFILGTRGEVHFSLLGTVFGVLSSLFVSLNGTLTKSTLRAVKEDKWVLQLYNNLNASILFLPLILMSGELTTIYEHSHLLVSARFWFSMILASLFGFGIGIATILQVQVTSPLTHNVVGTAKAAFQTALGFIIWQNPTTPSNVLGIALVLFGSLQYAYVRHREMTRLR